MEGPVIATEADLERVRRDQSGKCWWCESPADSREHRHKASQLKRMWDSDGVYLTSSGERPYKLRGWGSNTVKFGKTLCQDCNNARSQPFDRAYDVYVEFVQKESPNLARKGVIS